MSGPAALVADEFAVGEKSHIRSPALTFGVIAVMLLIVYRLGRHLAAHAGGCRHPGRPRRAV